MKNRWSPDKELPLFVCYWTDDHQIIIRLSPDDKLTGHQIIRWYWDIKSIIDYYMFNNLCLFVCLFIHKQIIIKLSSDDHQIITRWSSNDHQIITRLQYLFVCFLSVYNRWFLSDHQMITSWLPLVCLFVCLLSDNGWSSNDQQMISFVCLFVFCQLIADDR